MTPQHCAVKVVKTSPPHTVQIELHPKAPTDPPPAPAAPPLRRGCTAPATEMHTETRNKKVSAPYWLFPGQRRGGGVGGGVVNRARTRTPAAPTPSCATHECHRASRRRRTVYFEMRVAALWDHPAGSGVISHRAPWNLTGGLRAPAPLHFQFEHGRKRKARTTACRTPS